MEKSIIAIVPTYYPMETGFSLAFLNLHKAIIENQCVEKVHVIAPVDSLSTGNKNIILHKISDIRLQNRISKLFCLLGFRKYLPQIAYLKAYSELNKIIDVIINESSVKLIFVESYAMAWTVPYIKQKYNIPVMLRIHGTGPEMAKNMRGKDHRWRLQSMKWIFKSEYIAATTSYYMDFFHEFWGDYEHFIDKEFFIIPNTICKPQIQSENHSKNVFRLLQLGRMDQSGYYQKGFSDTIQALMYLEHIMEPEALHTIEYIAIGEGDRESYYEELISKLKYINNVHYECLSNIEVNKCIEESDVVLLPSRCEGMSMFGLEALAAGKAFIGTTNNGLRDIIIDNYNGISIKNYDYYNYAAAIEKLYFNRDLCIEYGKNSRKLYEKKYTYEKVANRFNILLTALESSTNLIKQPNNKI